MNEPKHVRLVNISVPLRDNFIANLQIPYDITQEEAERLVATIRTLPIPPEPQEESDG